ncbi:MAG: Tryptophan--tRNA ligase, mitochondrial [Pleopsidium flavum]|nr:MAG: Tryptophan--tRNA ligase, mitochondrial [Pleopsidium flavum]
MSTTAKSKPEVIFSGIQPTGVPHLGNYLGALRQWTTLQNQTPTDTKLMYSIVDLHAITVQPDPKRLRRWKRETLATMLAIGLDPTRSTIFYQSAVPAHTELMWILCCSASVGYLARMTQWKSKLLLPDGASFLDTGGKAKLKLGLFAYPVLQAADVLIHRATKVPVGDDQIQHLEFARKCATNFNNAYGNILPEPRTFISPAKRIMSLKEPLLKMSKSHEDPRSRILLTDRHEDIYSKIRLALTDSLSGVSYDPSSRPGVSNLIEIVHHLEGGATTCEELADEYSSLSMRQFKDMIADRVSSSLSHIRKNYERILKADDGRYLDAVAAQGALKASASAEETMVLVREAMGL